MNEKYGALPPENLKWQIGKTVASINFVNDAEKYIETCTDESVICSFHNIIRAIKNGTVTLQTPMTPEDFRKHLEKMHGIQNYKLRW